MSSFTDTVEREKQVDFVNYYSAGIQWASKKGKTVDPDNACGLKVAVETDTFEDTDEVPAKSKACTDAGKPAIQVLASTARTGDQRRRPRPGRRDQRRLARHARTRSRSRRQAPGRGQDLRGRPVRHPGRQGLGARPVLQKTIQALIDDGTYRKILDKWGVADGGVKTDDSTPRRRADPCPWATRTVRRRAPSRRRPAPRSQPIKAIRLRHPWRNLIAVAAHPLVVLRSSSTPSSAKATAGTSSASTSSTSASVRPRWSPSS